MTRIGAVIALLVLGLASGAKADPFYTFTPGADNPVSCLNEPTGGAHTGWVYTCTANATFSRGASVWGMARLDVTREFCVSAQLFKVGVSTPEATQTEWCSSGVEPWGWRGYVTIAWFQLTTDGDHEIHFHIKQRTEVNYPSTPFTTVRFSVTRPPSYVYTGYAITCVDQPTGGADTGWVYSCRMPMDRFVVSSPTSPPPVYTLVKVDRLCENFKLIAEIYRDGVLQGKDEPASFTTPASGCWNNYYSTFRWTPALPGTWTNKLYIEISGQPRAFLRDVTYTVVGP